MLNREKVKRRSLRSRLLGLVLRWRLKPKLTSDAFDPPRFRRWLDREMGRKPTADAVDIQPDEVRPDDAAEDGMGPPVPGEWYLPEGAPAEACVLYFHGGGYLFGSPLSYRSFTTQLAARSGVRVFAPDYRLAPEEPFPAAIDDALSSYRWLVEQHDIPADNIVLAGDSAGGGLALALVHALKAEDLPLPASVIALSPYADLAARGQSLDENARSCTMFTGEAIRRAASIYLQGAEPELALASPLYGDFTGFPPLLIYVSDAEALRDDGLRVAERADRAGTDVDLRVWRGQPHVWPIFYPLLPEAATTLDEMAAFVQRSLKR